VKQISRKLKLQFFFFGKKTLFDTFSTGLRSFKKGVVSGFVNNILPCTIDAPVCRHERILVVGASRGETLDIKCEVEADPPVVHFRWKFNNSGETLEVSSDRFYSEGPSSSVLRYTTASELDYGSLSCWAVNAVGHQVAPCVFQVSKLNNQNGNLDYIFYLK